MSTQRILDAALTAAARGWFVFPLSPGTKRPTIRAWPTKATTDSDRIRCWWNAHPSYNIAIATGPSGLHVIDLDIARDPRPDSSAPSGWDLLCRFARTVDEIPSLATYCVATPSGGRHLYYRTNPGNTLPCTVGRLGPHIDSRGEGGYIVAAGSRTAQGRYTIIDPRPPAMLPTWLGEMLSPTPHPHTDPARAPAALRNPDAYTAAIVTGETRKVATALPGTRNTILFKAAVTLGRLVAGGALDEHSTRRALSDAAAEHIGRHGFTLTEADAAITNGFAAGARWPRQLSTGPRP